MPPAPRAVVEQAKCGCNRVRDYAKGTALAHMMDWPAHLFANALQLVAATIITITGIIKMSIWRRRTLPDSS